ncbi:unnamed protein product [Spirodela intermedia]|uniref:Dof zinc finger protein n=1 Tax=Spirodela intermedia TaxID=51605 RepID=A0A7I8KJP3_SPIIN|nr:unnamed protein product [Spirodela intermedia]
MEVPPRVPAEERNLRCPRCESTNTKFCYYNNYNFAQPRHFCKACRRYWTRGGSLRNIPVGGASRKNTKRSAATASSHNKRSAHHAATFPAAVPAPPPLDVLNMEPVSSLHASAADIDRLMLNTTGSFTALLFSEAQFGNLLGSFHEEAPELGTFDLRSSTYSAAAALPPRKVPQPEDFLA